MYDFTEMSKEQTEGDNVRKAKCSYKSLKSTTGIS